MKRCNCQIASTSKKTAVLQKYRDGYTKEWPCLLASCVSENRVFCSVCLCDFSVAHSGQDDCRRHIESKKHNTYSEAKLQNKSVSSFFVKSNETAVTNAELLFTLFLLEHNIPLSVSDHAGNLFRAMFPDSKISQKYGCARTKTSALVQYTASETKKEISELLQKTPFSLATDGSTDSNAVKLYPIVVSFFNAQIGQISTLLLSLLESTDNTGEGIFSVINSELSSLAIPWVLFHCGQRIHNDRGK